MIPLPAQVLKEILFAELMTRKGLLTINRIEGNIFSSSNTTSNGNLLCEKR
jgi:hypothetical protein